MANVVHEDIDTAVFLENRLAEMIDAFELAHISFDCRRPTSALSDLFGSLLASSLVDFGDNDVGTMQRKEACRGRANPSSATSDDRHATVEQGTRGISER
jgi:hypothetical protein